MLSPEVREKLQRARKRLETFSKHFAVTAFMAVANPQITSAAPISPENTSPDSPKTEIFAAQNGKIVCTPEMLTDYISSQTFGELKQQGLLTQDMLKSYNFTKEDMQQLKPGKIATTIIRRLKSIYGDKTPSGKCLPAIRQAFNRATGQNIYSPTNRACDWAKNFTEDTPLIEIGYASHTGDGNIDPEALMCSSGIIEIYGGKKQPAGHVDITDNGCARSDGAERHPLSQGQKVGTRYAADITAYIPTDVMVFPQLAKHIAQQNIEKNKNQMLIAMVENGKITSISTQPDIFSSLLAKNEKDSSPAVRSFQTKPDTHTM